MPYLLILRDLKMVGRIVEIGWAMGQPCVTRVHGERTCTRAERESGVGEILI